MVVFVDDEDVSGEIDCKADETVELGRQRRPAVAAEPDRADPGDLVVMMGPLGLTSIVVTFVTEAKSTGSDGVKDARSSWAAPMPRTVPSAGE